MLRHYEPLGIAMMREMDSNSFTSTFLAEQLTPYMRIGTAGTSEHLRCVKQGYIYGTCGTPQNPEERLEWTAILLYALNFSEKYPEILAGIRRRAGMFKFPPDKGISYYELRKINGEELIKKGKARVEGLEAKV